MLWFRRPVGTSGPESIRAAPPQDAAETTRKLRSVFSSAVGESCASFSMLVDARGADYERCFPRLLAAFVKSHGRFVHVYWSEHFAGGLALTERRTWLLRRPTFELAAVCGTRTPVEVRRLGYAGHHEGD